MQEIKIMPFEIPDESRFFFSQELATVDVDGQTIAIVLNAHNGNIVFRINGKQYAVPLQAIADQVIPQILVKSEEKQA